MEESDAISEAIRTGTYDLRSWTSLRSHFNDISKKVFKYVRCLPKIESLQESGSNEKDKLLKAQELYRSENNSIFQYQVCYAELVKCPKFQNSFMDTRKRKSVDSDARPSAGAALHVETTSPELEQQEPDLEAKGVKASKKLRAQVNLQSRAVKTQETLSISMASKTEIAKSRLRIQEERALQSMLNELYAIEPRDEEHGALLRSRRSSLLERLGAFTTTNASGSTSSEVSS
ncbi:No apical meristem-associated C-terminal domain [Phytophthora infestans]|uniref:No apical meristem-associated C-terminal domain n=1 Tax=Phytophthora infestans TaxID=4787 RepID=A0A833VYW5_PHYIN|nr:No apical meristem-associated C-terminal domain [Phytophthora infestans]KAF4142413.1 No apical meristem-associated C-terminal domain [Phytophthora infestans]